MLSLEINSLEVRKPQFMKFFFFSSDVKCFTYFIKNDVASYVALSCCKGPSPHPAEMLLYELQHSFLPLPDKMEICKKFKTHDLSASPI